MDNTLTFNEIFERDLKITIALAHIELELMCLVAMQNLDLLEPIEIKAQAKALSNRYINLEIHALSKIDLDNPSFMPSVERIANPMKNLLVNYYFIGKINEFHEGSRCYHEDVVAERNLKRLGQYCDIQQKYAIQ